MKGEYKMQENQDEKKEKIKETVNRVINKAGIGNREDEESKEKKDISPETSFTDDMEDIEKETVKNLKETIELQEEIKKKQSEIETMRENKKKFKERVKDIVYFCPKICVEMNLCKCPEKAYSTCKNMIDSTSRLCNTCMKEITKDIQKGSAVTVSCVRLPLLRRKIKKHFHSIGSIAYKRISQGEKNIMDNQEIKTLLEKIHLYEKQIEEIESMIIRPAKLSPNEIHTSECAS